MPCTTILVGKKASYDGSTMIARNDDGFFDVKKLVVIDPKKQPKKYKSVIGHLEIELPENPLRYTFCPNVDTKNGLWGACGINEANVAMTATETISSNANVMGADPYVVYKKAEKKGEKDIPGGIGEEDLVAIVLPYIHSAREGVYRVAELLETYGTYEPNGMAFSDQDEIWWLETIGGHHWIAKRVKDEEYVMMPNQFGLDNFDFDDAFGAQKENMCSKDLKEFVEKYHLDLNNDGNFNPRNVFGSRTDQDHIYNTPRSWFIGRYFNPTTYKWDGENADFTPESDNIPWSMVPDKKITVEDVKYILSSYYQGTEYDPYSNGAKKGKYRVIGVAKTGDMAILQIRGYMPEKLKAVEWICFGGNSFNAALALYTNTGKMPKYVSETSMDVDTKDFYWGSRLIDALADPNYSTVVQMVERYQDTMANKCHEIIIKNDEKMIAENDFSLIDKANEELCAMAKKATTELVNRLMLEASKAMKTNFNRADH